MADSLNKFPPALRAELRALIEQPVFVRAVIHLKEMNEPALSDKGEPADRLAAGALANAQQVGFHLAFKSLQRLAAPLNSPTELPQPWSYLHPEQPTDA